MADNIVGELKMQGTAAILLVVLAIISVLGMVVLEEFRDVIHGMSGLGNSTTGTINATANAAVTAFIAGLVIFSTFATVTALIIVVKAVIGVVKGLR